MRKIVFVLFFLFLHMTVRAEIIRVNLVKNQESVQVQGENDFLVKDFNSGHSQFFSQGKYFLNVRGGILYLNDKKVGNTIVILRKDGGSLPLINQRLYSGVLVAKSCGKYIYLNNEIDLEFFITSTLPSKTSPIWPDEAIKAQAIAARSYAKYKKVLNRNIDYDIESTDPELPFLGLGQEKNVITKLVQSTVGQYLKDSDNIPVMAVTTVSSGGRTETGSNVFGVAYSYLQSVEDFDKDSPYYNWTYDVSPVMVRNLLEQSGEYIVGKIKSVYLSPLSEPGDDRTTTGRVKSILIQGEDGIARINADVIIRQLELNSALFDVETGVPLPDKVVAPIKNYYGMEIGRKDIPINWGGNRPKTWQGLNKSGHILKGVQGEKITFRGRGKGHGVGLSMWGAREMANNMKSAIEILAHYYPHTKLVKE